MHLDLHSNVKNCLKEKKIKVCRVALRSNFIISPHRIKWGMLQVGCMLSSGHTTKNPPCGMP